MPCDLIVDERGATIVCSRGPARAPRCATCGGRGVALCDALIEPLAFGTRPRTCDAPMCEAHRTPVGRNVDHCPAHVEIRA